RNQRPTQNCCHWLWLWLPSGSSCEQRYASLGEGCSRNRDRSTGTPRREEQQAQIGYSEPSWKFFQNLRTNGNEQARISDGNRKLIWRPSPEVLRRGVSGLGRPALGSLTLLEHSYATYHQPKPYDQCIPNS